MEPNFNPPTKTPCSEMWNTRTALWRVLSFGTAVGDSILI